MTSRVVRSSRLSGRTEQWRWILRAAVIPLTAFIATLVALKVAAIAAQVSVTSSGSWAPVGTDAGYYLDIARHGYTLSRCQPGVTTPFGHWCGNSGWFPLYSAAIAGLHLSGLSVAGAGVLISEVFALATLLLLWFGFFGAEASPRNLLSLVLAAFFPGWVYYHVVFPMSMAAFFVLLSFWWCQRRAFWAAGLAGALFAATYGPDVLLAPVLFTWALLDQREATSFLQRLRAGSLLAGLTGLGFAAVLVFQKLQTGAWDAYFKIQGGYHHGFRIPLATVFRRFDAVLHGHIVGDAVVRVGDPPLFRRFGGFYVIPDVQGCIVALMVVGVVVSMLRSYRRPSGLTLLVLLYTAAFWLFPLTQYLVSWYRTDALLIPVVLLIALLPVGAQVATGTAVTLVAVPMAFAFFERILI